MKFKKLYLQLIFIFKLRQSKKYHERNKLAKINSIYYILITNAITYPWI